MARDLNLELRRHWDGTPVMANRLTLAIDAETQKAVEERIRERVKKTNRVKFEIEQTYEGSRLLIKVFIPRDYRTKDLEGFFGLGNRIVDLIDPERYGVEIKITPELSRAKPATAKSGKATAAATKPGKAKAAAAHLAT